MIEAHTQRQPSAAPKEKARNASKRNGPPKSLNQSNAMNSKRLTIIRGRFCRHNLGKPSALPLPVPQKRTTGRLRALHGTLAQRVAVNGKNGVLLRNGQAPHHTP